MIPARESAPRDNHDNFYWLQEDYLKEKARQHGFTWTILRPQLIVGRPWGVAMNLVPIIGAYAAICTEEGLPFSFTGGAPYVWEAVDARLMAEVIEWAGASPAAVNEHFNVTNGDVFEWRNLWPGMAEVLGVERVPMTRSRWPSSLRISMTYGIGSSRKRDYGRFHCETSLANLTTITTSAPPMGQPRCPRREFSSRIKLQRAGFTGCHDTQEPFNYWLRDLIHRRVIPGPASSAA